MAVKAKTPATNGVPFIREFPYIGSLRAHIKDRLSFYQRVIQEHGNVCGFHLGPLPIILFNSPQYAYSILVEHANDFSKGQIVQKALGPFTGISIFLSEGDSHRQQRKLIAPAFQPRQISNYAETMVHYSEQIVQSWHDGTTLAINQQMSALTLSIMGKVLFDSDVFNETDALCKAAMTKVEYAGYLMSRPISIPLSWPTPRNHRTRRAIEVLDNRIQQMIDERRASTQERNDTLSVLLRARDEDGSQMSDRQLMDECQTLFGAGYETTATALTWTCYLLTTHPAIYQKVQQEVDTILQGRTPTYADLACLPYCLQIFKETLRLYPPAYIIPREALQDVEIGGYLVPKGYHALIPVYVLHRNPDYFPNPEQFDPDRFTPEREKELPRCAYMPFGAGPRICLGNYFALMEGHLLLATLAQQVTFELVPGQTIKADPSKTVTLHPNHEVMVKVRKR
jgi:cytochrome P450